MVVIEGNKVYSAQEVADMIGVHIQSVRRWIKTNKLQAIKIGRNLYISSTELKKLSVSGFKEPTESKDKEPVETVGDSGKTYENLKNAILWVLEQRESTLNVDELAADTLNKGYQKTAGKIDPLLKKHLPKEMIESGDFGYAYMTIYGNAFKQGYATGYYELLEDIENLIKHDQLDLD